MHSAITWGSLFGVGLILAGLVGIGVGFIMVFAGGMSDAPAEGDATSSEGCVVALLATLTLILGAALLLHH